MMPRGYDGIKIGDRVDSVGGIFKNGEVMAVRIEGSFIILTIKWANGKTQERSSRTVNLA